MNSDQSGDPDFEGPADQAQDDSEPTEHPKGVTQSGPRFRASKESLEAAKDEAPEFDQETADDGR